MSEQNGAEVFLDILNGFGVEAIFSSPGSEWPPLWEALARRKAAGDPAPTYHNARHEDLAIGMAMGYARASGKLGVCLIHATVGTLHASMGIRAAYQEGIPLLVCAGESVTFGEGKDAWVGAQWGRFLADPGGPARLVDSFVKSSFGLNTPIVLAGAVHRACRIAMAAPCGPVFLSLPFEYLAQPAMLPAPTRYDLPAPPQPEPSRLQQAATWLAAAERPLIITEDYARSAAAVAPLVELAERLGAVVVEGQHPGYVNFPRGHDLHGGFNAAPYLKDADVILLLESPGPWYPPTALTPPEAKIIAVGDDPLRQRSPYTGFTADLSITGDALAAVQHLLREISPQPRAGARRQTVAQVHSGRRAAWREQALAQRASTPIDARYLCLLLDERLPDNALVVDETIISHHTIIHVMQSLAPGRFLNALSGGLGLGLGMALGAGAARPEAIPVMLIGDGTFNYNPALAALGYAQEYRRPLLVVVFNNGRYRSMQMGTELLYPQGAAVRTDVHFGAPIAPSPDYGRLADIFGGHGETVADPADLPAAIDRAVAAVNTGLAAVLNVQIGDELAYLLQVFAPDKTR